MTTDTPSPREAEAPERWRDMASAPKDGTLFLLLLDGEYYLAFWRDGEWADAEALGIEAGGPGEADSLWRPLPPPPGQEPPPAPSPPRGAVGEGEGSA